MTPRWVAETASIAARRGALALALAVLVVAALALAGALAVVQRTRAVVLYLSPGGSHE